MEYTCEKETITQEELDNATFLKHVALDQIELPKYFNGSIVINDTDTNSKKSYVFKNNQLLKIVQGSV